MNFFAIVIVSIFFNFVVRPQINHCRNEWRKNREVLWPVYEKERYQAMCMHNDLFDLIRQMYDNPFVMDSDWRALLPVCRYSDDWYARTWPDLKPFKLESCVREILDPPQQHV